MSISVIIPFYNAEAYFAEALQSVLNQGRAASEIIVVNDSPSERSAAFLSQFADRCTVYSMPENRGVSAARNAGVGQASGEWIAFLDADDYWNADKLDQQYSFLTRNSEYDGCHTGVRVFNGDNTVAQYLAKSPLLTRADLLASSQVVPSSFMLRRSTFISIGGFDETLGSSEDYDLSLRLVLNDQKIGFIPLPLTNLRRENHDNISSNWRKTLNGHCSLVMKHRDFYLRAGGFNVTRQFIGKSFQSSGYRCGGLRGKLLILGGRLLSLGAGVDQHQAPTVCEE